MVFRQQIKNLEDWKFTSLRRRQMNYEEYRKAYFTEPSPEPRFRFRGTFGVTLFFEDFDNAVAYYHQVLGPPAYVEGKVTRGWQIGDGWLTLLQGKSGNPRNVEITLQVATTGEAERLQQAFIEAGGKGAAPSDVFMYEPVRACQVQDPFRTEIMIIGPQSSEIEFPLQSYDKVRYADTDRQGHVNNAHFATFFETGRVEVLYNSEFPILAEGASFVIASLKLEFLKEITWPGRVDIGTGILKIGNSSITIFQKLFNNGKCVANAETVVVQVDGSGRGAPLTEQARKTLAGWMLSEAEV
jgi:acyl-CoA thioester hydrolase